MCKHFTQYFSLSILCLIFFSFSIIQAQVDTLWTKTFGGNIEETGYSVQQISDGGYIIIGYTSSFGAGGWDVWLIKTNADGDTLWTKTFGGSDYDQGKSVKQTQDEGYIITGGTSSFGTGNSDVWLIKTNADGDTLWTKTFGGSGYEAGYSVQQASDGGYIITGYTSSFGAGDNDVWLIKTNASGDTLWTKTYGGNSDDYSYSVRQTKDDGYIITGYTQSFGAGVNDIWLIKTNASGDTLWTKTFGGSGYDVALSVQQTMDEGYIMTGSTRSFNDANGDVWLIKTDVSGDILWTKTYGGGDYDMGYSVQQTIDKGYIVAGTTSSFGANIQDIWLIKTNTDGDTIWTKTFVGSGANVAFSVQQTTDEGYIITGWTTSFDNGNGDIWLIKTTADATIVKKNNNNILSDYKLFQNFPNPFNPKTTFKFSIPKSDQVTISIYTISGQMLESKTMNFNPGSYSFEFDGSKYSTGIYFYKISTSSGFTAERKMLLLK